MPTATAVHDVGIQRPMCRIGVDIKLSSLCTSVVPFKYATSLRHIRRVFPCFNGKAAACLHIETWAGGNQDIVVRCGIQERLSNLAGTKADGALQDAVV